MRRWSGCLRSCISCCPSSCNKEERSDIQQAATIIGHVEEPDNILHQAIIGHVEEPLNASHDGEAPLNIDTQVREFTLKEQQLPPLSLDELDALLTLIRAQVKSLSPSGSAPDTTMQLMRSGISQYEERKEVVTSFIQSLPKEFIKKVVGGGKEVLIPLLTNTLGGMENLQWVGIGLRLIGWSLDNMHATVQNSEECLEMLRDAVDLMEKTKKIWEQSSHYHQNATNEDLQKSIEIAFRCAIICIAHMDNNNVLRFIDAQRIKGVIVQLKQDLRDAKFNNVSYMVTEQYCHVPKVDRQVSFADDYCNDRVGGDAGTREAMEYLMKDCNDMIALCLHGMGGVGKSFIGMDIFKKFQKSKRLQKESPYNSCRVELELGIRDEKKLVDIQKQILLKLCGLEKPDVFDCIEGREKLTKELKEIKGPVFLYLDNVLEPHHLEKILPKASSFPEGSKLLVTSRVGENIQTAMIRSVGIRDCKLIEIKMMQDDQAKKLLWRQISGEEKQGEVSRSVALEELEEKVLKLCGGLPLALKVVGGYIGNAKRGAADTRVWQTVLNAMEKAEPLKGEAHDELYSRIEFSIEMLHPNIQSTFLDIVSYYDTGTEWKSIERLVNPNHLEILHQRALVHKTRALVESSSDAASLIEIHDVLIALARRMINDDTHELRITGMDNFKQDNGILEKVVALKGVSLKACMLKQMPHLRFLKDVYVEGEGEEAQLRHLSVVHDLRSRTGNLFNLDECEGLKEVYWSRAVDQKASDLELLRHKNISKELEVLRLEKWKRLKNVDVIETLRCLKELALRECTEISDLPEGINSLTNLEDLDLSSCTSLQSLPNGCSSLTALTTLNLLGCSSLQMLPEGMGSLISLTRLCLRRCTAIQCLPEGIGGLQSLTQLDLEECSSLQRLPEGVRGLKSLTELSLYGCSSLQCLPEGICGLKSLTELSLLYCSSLQSLPGGVGGLKSLTKLYMWGCSSLLSLPKEFAGMTSLEVLTLGQCSSLQSLPEELACLTCLTMLDLSECGRLLKQPVLQMLTSLTHLHLRGCDVNLESLEAVTAMTRLTEINLSGCASLQMLPEGFSRLTRLTSLDLSGTSSLNSLQEIRSFTGLKSLAVANCEGLYSLMEEGAFSTLGMLTRVELSGHRCLQYRPESLQYRPESIASLTSLERLSFEGRDSLQFLPDELTSLMGLKDLTLTKWESVQSLPQGITSLVHLERLSWNECRSLKALPRGGAAQYWTCLWCLDLQGCSSLQSLQEIAGFTGLRHLRLEGCASVELSMLEDIWKLTGLRGLNLSQWENIQALPECGLARLTRLGRLDLSGCTSLLCVPEEVTRLTSLVSLNLEGCKSLKCLPQGLSTLAGLHLNLCDCTSLLEKDISLREKESLKRCEATRLSHYPNLFQIE